MGPRRIGKTSLLLHTSLSTQPREYVGHCFLSLGALLVWQAPAFVQRSVLSIWRTAKALWDTLGQIGDASGGLIVIILVLSIAVAGVKTRKQFRQILHELWE